MRDDAGAVLRSARRERRWKQQVLADAAGIARETLSRIEGARAAASPQTMDALLAALELDWRDVAVAGVAARRARPFHETSRGEALLRFGREARALRRAAGESLATAAARLGVSASQLSRVERGHALRGRLVVELDAEAQAGQPYDDRRVALRPDVIRRYKSVEDQLRPERAGGPAHRADGGAVRGHAAKSA